jgi:hypothetical protein
MTRDQLADRILELFPSLAEVEPREWAETEDSEPVVMIEGTPPSPAWMAVPST